MAWLYSWQKLQGRQKKVNWQSVQLWVQKSEELADNIRSGQEMKLVSFSLVIACGQHTSASVCVVKSIYSYKA